MVHVVLTATRCGFRQYVCRLALGADEQHASPAGGHVADRFQRPMQQRHRLLKVDDVNVIPLAEDERTHLRVPAAGGMSEMNACFQELAHRE